MLKPEFAILKRKSVISSNADNVFCRRLRKPTITIFKRFVILLLKTAEISCVNQNIALGYINLPMLSVGIRNETDFAHFRKNPLLRPNRRRFRSRHRSNIHGNLRWHGDLRILIIKHPFEDHVDFAFLIRADRP